MPLSFDKAKKIVKEKLDQDIYNQLFENNGSEKVSVWIDTKVAQDARNAAVERNVRLNTLVEEAICEYLNIKK